MTCEMLHPGLRPCRQRAVCTAIVVRTGLGKGPLTSGTRYGICREHRREFERYRHFWLTDINEL